MSINKNVFLMPIRSPLWSNHRWFFLVLRRTAVPPFSKNPSSLSHISLRFNTEFQSKYCPADQ